MYRAMNAALLDAPPLRRPATVVRARSHVANHRNLEARRLECAKRGLAACARALHVDAKRAHAVLHRLLGAVLGRELRREGRGLARPLEALLARTGPGERIATDIGDRDDGVVERRLDVRDPRLHVLLDLPLGTFFLHNLLLGRRLLLAGHGLARTLSGPGVGVRSLPTHRETPPVAQTAITSDVHQQLDVLS